MSSWTGRGQRRVKTGRVAWAGENMVQSSGSVVRPSIFSRRQHGRVLAAIGKGWLEGGNYVPSTTVGPGCAGRLWSRGRRWK